MVSQASTEFTDKWLELRGGLPVPSKVDSYYCQAVASRREIRSRGCHMAYRREEHWQATITIYTASQEPPEFRYS